MGVEICPCGSNELYIECCQPIIKGDKKAKSALQLMKSRYSAYVHCEVDYIVKSTEASQRKYYPKKDLLKWAKESQWLKLEIIEFTSDTVEFKAFYNNSAGQLEIHHEFSTFVSENETWYFVQGEALN